MTKPRAAEAFWRPAALGLATASLLVVLIWWSILSSVAPQPLANLVIELAKDQLGKLASVGAVGSIACAALIWLTRDTRWGAKVHWGAVATVGLVVAGGAIVNVLGFCVADRAEVYPLRAQPSPILAESIAAMPDKFPAVDVLLWLRQHAARASLSASAKELQSAGLAYHRLVGIAHLHVRLREASAIDPPAIVGDREFVPFHVAGARRKILIDAAQARPGGDLCALATADALLFISAADAPGCEATQ